MYRFSRSIYRELASRVIEDPSDQTGCRNKQRVLDACEAAIRRLTTDRRYFARPARSLFNEVRVHFAMSDQLRVWMVIERNINLAQEFLARMPDGAGLAGQPRRCQAHTRRGTACRREPLPSKDYCPSHKHLEETFDGPELELELIDDPGKDVNRVRAAA
ncbi:MAG TPA: hypothetical protein VHJ54_01295 [Solirubrobacterales bacterium]|jgi:hypothetical protein|nr:hypothetical protein [Solirubrobacterales bacterium]